MSENTETGYSEYLATGQVNYPFSETFSASGKIPVIAKRIWETLSDAQGYIDDIDSSAIPGLILSVMSDTDEENNGIYFVKSTKASLGTDESGELIKAGAGEGSGTLTVDTISDAFVIANEEGNTGQIIYVTTGTGEDGYEGDVYTAGPYIVTGVGVIYKLSTSSATEEDVTAQIAALEGNVSTLQTQVSTLESEMDAVEASILTKQDTLTAGTLISIDNNVISTTAQVNVQADWEETDEDSDAFILNKPEIPEVSEWALAETKPTYTASEVGALPDTTEIPSVDGLASTTYVDTAIANLVDSAPETLDTLSEIATAIGETDDALEGLLTTVSGKQDALTAGANITIEVDEENGDALTISAVVDLSGKQDVLTAGTNISIEDNVISAVVDLSGKQDVLTSANAGDNITIEEVEGVIVISAADVEVPVTSVDTTGDNGVVLSLTDGELSVDASVLAAAKLDATATINGVSFSSGVATIAAGDILCESGETIETELASKLEEVSAGNGISVSGGSVIAVEVESRDGETNVIEVGESGVFVPDMTSYWSSI